MKISQLPEELRKLALEYQKNTAYSYYSKTTDELDEAFNWEHTKEGDDFWFDWYNTKWNPTEDLKLHQIHVSLIDKSEDFKINCRGIEGNFYISKEEAKRLIEFLQAQI